MISIEEITENTPVIILKIEGGKNIELKLKHMGIREGDSVLVLQNGRTGPIILQKDHSRIALGRGMSKNIYVERPNE